MQKDYKIPEQIVDAKEEKLLKELTEAYNKIIKPSKTTEMVNKLNEKIPPVVKQKAELIKNDISENELFIKSLTTLGKGFGLLEQYAAKITLSEKQVIEAVNKISKNNKITTLDEFCLVRGYEISKIVDKYKLIDIGAALTEGAATGAPGFVGIPFNLILSTFLYYRSVQSIALFYGYDIKNDPAELKIASEVFMNAMNPKNSSDNELSSTIAKIMLLSTATSVKQTVKKGWEAMAEKGGVHLLIVQLRALANGAAKKALEKAGKKGLEKTVFTEIFEQIGKKLTQKTVSKSIPYVGAFVGAVLDTSQMLSILNYANIFYQIRFILEKEARIYTLLGYTSDVIETENFTTLVDDEPTETTPLY